MDIKLGQNYVNFFRTGTKIDKGKSNNEPDKVAEEEKSEQQKPIVPEGKPITASVSDLAGLYGQSIVTPIKPGERIKGEKPDKSGDDNYDSLVAEWESHRNAAVKFPYDEMIELLDKIIACAPEDRKAEWVIRKVTIVHNRQVYELTQYQNKTWDEIFRSGILDAWADELEYLSQNDILLPNGSLNDETHVFATDNIQEDWKYLGEVYNNLPIPQQIEIMKANIQSWEAIRLAVTLKLKDPNLSETVRLQYENNLADIEIEIGIYQDELQRLENMLG